MQVTFSAYLHIISPPAELLQELCEMCKKFKNSVDKHRKGWYTHIRCQVNGFDLQLVLRASEKKVEKNKKSC